MIKKCPICNKKCDGNKGLITHASRMHFKELNECPLCGKELKNFNGLKQHLYTVHDITEVTNSDIIIATIHSFKGEHVQALKELNISTGRRSKV